MALGADLLGFNFFQQSKRYIPPAKAAEIISELPVFVTSVGIMVSPTLQNVLELLHICKVDALQIYEPVDFSTSRSIPIPVISAIRVRQEEPVVNPLPDAQLILLDSYSPQAFGGTGTRLDWRNLPADIPEERLVLAGGITPDKVAQLLRVVRPAVIDVASGVEKSPGKKDVRKMASLMEAVQKAGLREERFCGTGVLLGF